MTKQEIFEQVKKKQSYLCIGLDTDVSKIPSHLRNASDPVFEFNRQIIEATKEFAVAYKPNLAFYESRGPGGLRSLERTMSIIPKDIFTIADAKRGDIGNTSAMYAETFFNHYRFDAVTVAPYMGKDSVMPFLNTKGKWVILLALTSNEGSSDFQNLVITNKSGESKSLYEEVLGVSKKWGTDENMMFVVGATH